MKLVQSKWILGVLSLTVSVSGTVLMSLSGCSDTPGSSLPTLSAADANSVAPCPDQTLLTDAQFRTDFKAATAYSFYWVTTATPGATAQDDFCHRDAAFANIVGNTTATASITFTSYNLATLFTKGFGYCGTTQGVDNQLPKAGTYRMDGKFTANGRTYRLRVRATITAGSPDVLGSTFASQGLTPASLESQIQFSLNGTTLTPDSTMHTALADAAPSFTIEAKKASDSSTLFSAKMEVICAKQE